MEWIPDDDNVRKRIRAMCDRVERIQADGVYFYNMPVTDLQGGSRVVVNGRTMGMFASYSYLGLIGHPRINRAAQAPI